MFSPCLASWHRILHVPAPLVAPSSTRCNSIATLSVPIFHSITSSTPIMKLRLPFSRLAAAILVASTACGAFPSQSVDSTDLASVASTSLAGYRKPCPMPSSAFPQLSLPSSLTPLLFLLSLLPRPQRFPRFIGWSIPVGVFFLGNAQTSTSTCPVAATRSLSKP